MSSSSTQSVSGQLAKPVVMASTKRSPRVVSALQAKFGNLVRKGHKLRPFAVCWQGDCWTIGTGQPEMTLNIVSKRGLSALASLDEYEIAMAYIHQDIDVDGSIYEIFNYRSLVADRHPLIYFWTHFIHPVVFGQINSDKKWIIEHYDEDADFYTLFMDKNLRCYSHAFFASDSESLEAATERKFHFAVTACGIKPGDRVLDIGGGWGAGTEYVGKLGANVTSLTISDASFRYVTALIERLKLPATVRKEHFFEHQSEKPYDAILNFGVTEHMTDYARTIRQYERLLKPGGRIYLDCVSSYEKHRLSTFAYNSAYRGNVSAMAIPDYFVALSKSKLEVILFENDRHSYYLTAKHWAQNLEAAHDEVARRWGEALYRRFRLYLWSVAHALETSVWYAHHMVLERPGD